MRGIRTVCVPGWLTGDLLFVGGSELATLALPVRMIFTRSAADALVDVFAVATSVAHVEHRMFGVSMAAQA
jgi:hypothetical protein